MKILPPDPLANELHARTIVAHLMGAGVAHAFVAPGSRSTPLVAALHASGLPMTLVVDERAAGFAAVGAARAGVRAVVLTTSGTAVANLLPALCEASADELSWVALTADRPTELVGIGANQTLDQPPLLAGAARAVVDLPAPPRFDGSYETLRTALSQLDASSPGPVHVNARFAKPLEPTTVGTEPIAALGRPRPSPWCSVPPAPWLDAERGLVVVGALRLEDRAHVDALLTRLPWPAVVDLTSGLNRCDRFRPGLFRNALVREQLDPDRVLWIGGRATEPAIAQWLKAIDVPITQWKSGEATRDPESFMLDSVRVSFAHALPDPATARTSALRAPLETFQELEPSVRIALNELWIARTVAESVGARQNLFVGNSMPVRDVDRLVRRLVCNLICNRGASGIDGNLATAFGAWRVTGLPTTMLVGDLTFLHDVGTLALIRHERAALRIIVVNNGGGGIFHFLPIADNESLFEPWFGAPHSADAVAIARSFGLIAKRVTTPTELREVLAHKPVDSELIEIMTDRTENRALHADFDDTWQKALEAAR